MGKTQSLLHSNSLSSLLFLVSPLLIIPSFCFNLFSFLSLFVTLFSPLSSSSPHLSILSLPHLCLLCSSSFPKLIFSVKYLYSSLFIAHFLWLYTCFSFFCFLAPFPFSSYILSCFHWLLLHSTVLPLHDTYSNLRLPFYSPYYSFLASTICSHCFLFSCFLPSVPFIPNFIYLSFSLSSSLLSAGLLMASYSLWPGKQRPLQRVKQHQHASGRWPGEWLSLCGVLCPCWTYSSYADRGKKRGKRRKRIHFLQ